MYFIEHIATMNFNFPFQQGLLRDPEFNHPTITENLFGFTPIYCSKTLVKWLRLVNPSR